MIQALIFDFDGLILDTEQPEYQAWCEIYESFGCALPLSEWAACVGRSAEAFDPCDYLETQLGRSVDRESLHHQRRQHSMELIAAQSIRPGVEDYLNEARRLGLKVGLASSSSYQWVSGHLIRLGLFEYFDCIKCRDHVEHAKPDPALYHAALETLHVPARCAIALEDSPNGALAAKRAGIFCVAVPNDITREFLFEQVDLRLNSLADLTLEALLARAAAQDAQ
jgi:HAD superfamily hydrolase (TIGR01509 family)